MRVHDTDIRAQYQQKPIIASYIAKIVPGSLEADVDHLWTNLLAYYFPSSENYGIEREAYIKSQSKTKANVCVSTLGRRPIFKAIMVENKRPSESATGHPPPSSWAHAKGQLLNYMLSQREDRSRIFATTFGIVGIGKYVRFYQLRRENEELNDYQDGLIYHLDTDSAAIERKLLAMKRYIARYR